MGLLDTITGMFKKGGSSAGGSAGGSSGGGSALGGIPGLGNIPGLSALTGSQGGLIKSLLPALLGSGVLSHLGGLSGIMSKLGGSPIAAQASSWVGTGPNEEVHPDQLEAALGTDTVASIAKEAGVSHDEAKSGLASLLPKLVNQVTPGGSLPGAGQLSGILGGLDLKKLLG